MKNLKNFLGLILLAFFSAYAVDGIGQDNQNVGEKEVIVITKKIDENGNEVVDKKVFNSHDISDEELEKLIKAETGSEVAVNSWESDGGIEYKIEIDDQSNGSMMIKEDNDLEEFMNSKGLTPNDIENIDINVETSMKNGVETTTKTMSIEDKKGEKHFFELNEDHSSGVRINGDSDHKEIRIMKMQSDKKPKLGVIIAENNNDGVLIEEVIKGSPAEKIGLQKNDVIVAVGDSPVTDIESLLKALDYAGDTSVIAYKRNGEQKASWIEFTSFEYDAEDIEEKETIKKVITVDKKDN